MSATRLMIACLGVLMPATTASKEKYSGSLGLLRLLKIVIIYLFYELFAVVIRDYGTSSFSILRKKYLVGDCIIICLWLL
jgi:hypothetical protein